MRTARGQTKIPESFSFTGRTFLHTELNLIQQICSDFQALGRTEISRTVCELLEWRRPNGSLKNHECRLLLERLEELEWLDLPPLRSHGPGLRCFRPRVVTKHSICEGCLEKQRKIGQLLEETAS